MSFNVPRSALTYPVFSDKHNYVIFIIRINASKNSSAISVEVQVSTFYGNTEKSKHLNGLISVPKDRSGHMITFDVFRKTRSCVSFLTCDPNLHLLLFRNNLYFIPVVYVDYKLFYYILK